MNWIPIKTIPMNEEEKRMWVEEHGLELPDHLDYRISEESVLPADREEVLICTRSGDIDIDYLDSYICGKFFSFNGYDVIAWMPLPEPYKVERSKNETD